MTEYSNKYMIQRREGREIHIMLSCKEQIWLGWQAPSFMSFRGKRRNYPASS